MAAPSAEETKLIEELRQRMGDALKKPEDKDDLFLLRWLRARDLDVEKAEEMLRASLKWREERKMNTEEVNAKYAKDFPYFMYGQDKEGRLAVAIPAGTWNHHPVVVEERQTEFQMYLCSVYDKALETMREMNLKRGPNQSPVTQVVLILDWIDYIYTTGLWYSRSIPNLLPITPVFEANYPEVISNIYFINGPNYMHVFYSKIEPTLAPATVKKVKMYGRIQDEWVKALLEVIEKDELIKICSNAGIKLPALT